MENVLHKVDCYMELVLAKDSDLWEGATTKSGRYWLTSKEKRGWTQKTLKKSSANILVDRSKAPCYNTHILKR